MRRTRMGYCPVAHTRWLAPINCWRMTRRWFAERPTIKNIMPRTGSESWLGKKKWCTENAKILKHHRRKWYENNKERFFSSQRTYVQNTEHVRQWSKNRGRLNGYWRGYYAKNIGTDQAKTSWAKTKKNRLEYRAFWGLRPRVWEPRKTKSMQPGYYFKCRFRLWESRNIWNTLSVTWKWKLVSPKGIGTRKTCWRTRGVPLAKHVVYIENICYKSLKNFIFNFLCDPWLLQAMCAFSTQRHSNLYVLQLKFTTRFIELPSCLTFCPVKARRTLPKPLLVTSSSFRAYPPLMTSAYGEGFSSWHQPSEGFPYWRHPIDVTKNPLMLSSWTPPHTRARTPSLYHRLDHPLAPLWPLCSTCDVTISWKSIGGHLE